MITTDNQERPEPPAAPLALHIRRLRQWYGDTGLSQAELARLAGLTPRQVRSYESCRTLPAAVEAVLKLALALRVPVEGLFDPRRVEELRSAIEEARLPREQAAPAEEPPGSRDPRV